MKYLLILLAMIVLAIVLDIFFRLERAPRWLRRCLLTLYFIPATSYLAALTALTSAFEFAAELRDTLRAFMLNVAFEWQRKDGEPEANE